MPRLLRKDEKRLRAVLPNLGIEIAYRRQLLRAIDNLHRSVIYWVRAAYRAHPPAMAQDAPADDLRVAISKLGRRWQKQFRELAPALAQYFALDVRDRSDSALKKILRDAGFAVTFVMTPEMRDILAATVAENVGLIRSIPQQYLRQVEGMVMRSVQTGRDLGTLTRELEDAYQVTRRRAALIARDQNNKATSALVRARQTDLGIEDGIWCHSNAGKKPRPQHVKMDGRRFPLSRGMWDDVEGKYVWPGELINCHCTWKPVIPGLRP